MGWLNVIPPARESMKMKLAKMLHEAALLCAVLNLMAGVNPALAALAHLTPPTRDPNCPTALIRRRMPTETSSLARLTTAHRK